MTGTADFGKIIAGASTDPACQLALDLFIDRIIGFIGSYYVKLGGKVDALVFAGGIGEKGASFRKMIVEKVACLGFVVDDAKNDKPADETVADIGSGDARHRTLVCKTDEQVSLTICFDVRRHADSFIVRDGKGMRRRGRALQT
jgi:acetate kinase